MKEVFFDMGTRKQINEQCLIVTLGIMSQEGYANVLE